MHRCNRFSCLAGIVMFAFALFAASCFGAEPEESILVDALPYFSYGQLSEWCAHVQRPGWQLAWSKRTDGFLFAIFLPPEGGVAFCYADVIDEMKARRLAIVIQVDDAKGNRLAGLDTPSEVLTRRFKVVKENFSATIRRMDGELWLPSQKLPDQIRVRFEAGKEEGSLRSGDENNFRYDELIDTKGN